ncbi:MULTISPECIES: helix-turn-helix domain-containing protein [Bacillus]|uniref:helix-turn-helix domain-containing protein n=1 Tax=Bacillus TaxID=1386 RepID=UPI000BEC9764|nr:MULTISPECIES: helix-turn-helix domain-containing protein [Bacillus]MBJ8063819.1 helix-turn-helix domain-containing protein [Bacillus cereus group sp. N15]MCS3594967.1 putative transcriptional regulator [Bacillus sp. JUb91]PEB29004.1 transcriptional regulator [Bacillus toyonensis]TBX47831.1 helix-turn-helix domain-containing protein [Bacillus toyonensis]HDR7444360.1 helix-turn-helix domain-containing protein [Bacillus toyonensis]
MKELRKYESFKSVTEMDNTIDKALKEYNLKDSERVILIKLSQYSCKFVGVSYMKNQTLADSVGYSKRTVQRALKRLSELGIITRIEQKRAKSGGYGAFICVVNPFECHLKLSSCQEAESPTPEEAERQTEENKTIIPKANLREINKRNELDVSYLDNSHVPIEFISAVKPFIGSAKEVYSLWGKVLLAQGIYAPDLLDSTEIAIQAFKQSVFAKKMKRIRKDFKGYLFGVLAKMFSVEQRRYNKGNLWNWLEV